MAPVTTWTGWEANALRKALRMSVTDFAEHLGAARRTVAKWSSRGRDIQLRHDMQAALDTVLARSPEDVHERFTRSLQAGIDGALGSTDADQTSSETFPIADTGHRDIGDLDA